MNSKRWSRTLAATAIMVIATSALSACGRSDTPGPDSTPRAGAAISDGPATGKITVWAMGDTKPFEATLNTFKADNPDADVEVTAIPWASAHDKIAAALAAQTLPDVIQVGTTWMGEWGSTGAFDPTPEGLLSENDFYPGPWSTTVIDGTQYGVPYGVDPAALIYRKDLADQAGLSAPTTWDELKTFASTIQSKGLAKYGTYVPNSGAGLWATTSAFAFQAGGDVLNKDATKYDFSNEAWNKALTFQRDLINSGLSPDRLLQAAQEDVAGFVNGDIASFYGGSGWVDLILQQGGPGFADKVGIATVPAATKDGSHTSIVGGANFTVSANASNRDGSWKLLKYLASPTGQLAWYEAAKGIPTNKLAWTSKVTSDPIVSRFQDGLNSGKAIPAVPTWAQVSAVLDTQFEKAIAGASSPEDALAEAQRQADRIGTGK